jgi:hypothetical protein
LWELFNGITRSPEVIFKRFSQTSWHGHGRDIFQGLERENFVPNLTSKPFINIFIDQLSVVDL